MILLINNLSKFTKKTALTYNFYIKNMGFLKIYLDDLIKSKKTHFLFVDSVKLINSYSKNQKFYEITFKNM